MSLPTKNINTLLNKVDVIVKHQKEMTIAKGEHYNMFSVLKIETRENNTHSAFLADLLNPKGAHKLGDVFLKLFLDVVKPEIQDGSEEKYDNKFPTKDFETTKAFVKVEHAIGKVNLCKEKHIDNAKASGGRIDILLTDTNGTLISIENKIHASDQERQIQRYYNYETEINTVFYLTLKGEEPSTESRLKLNSGEHFHNISYKHDIREWLELCLKEVTNFTSLRETINQYILLIKKLTYTLNTKEDKELMEVMLQNLEATKYIKENYEKMLGRIRDNFRIKLKVEVEKALDAKLYAVSIGGSIENKFAQLWISLLKKPEPEFFIGIESFTGKGHLDGGLFVGIFNANNSKPIADLDDENKINSIWRQVVPIKSEAGNAINLSDDYWIKVLSNQDSDEYIKVLARCTDVIVEFVEKYEKDLFKEDK
jgi:hypothetical protein